MNQVEQWISISGRLLGNLFYYSPTAPQTQAMLDFLKRPDWHQQWQFQPNQRTLDFIQQGIHEPLDEPYQRLFIGPNSLVAPPWGSVYLDPENVIFGSSLGALKTFLQQQQITFMSDQTEPEDHIGLMLMLAAYIAETIPMQLTAYLQQHVLPWSARYLELLSTHADNLFYQGIALLTQETVQHWQTALNISPNQLKIYY